jgi:hypothetical protein
VIVNYKNATRLTTNESGHQDARELGHGPIEGAKRNRDQNQTTKVEK